MSGVLHRDGFCTCRTHLRRPWRRSEHWSARDVAYLEQRFGRLSEESIARHLGRSLVGVGLKAQRLGLRKRDVGLSARAVAQLFGVDTSTVLTTWMLRGPLRAHRPTYSDGARHPWAIDEEDLRAFIRDFPWYIDRDRVPGWSWVRDLLGERWYGLPEIHRLTGRDTVSEIEIAHGTIRAEHRGAHWYVPASEIPKIRALPPAIAAESYSRREQELELRRNRRKGVAA